MARSQHPELGPRAVLEACNTLVCSDGQVDGVGYLGVLCLNQLTSMLLLLHIASLPSGIIV